MRNFTKFWGIIAFALIIGFTFAACDSSSGGGTNPGADAGAASVLFPDAWLGSWEFDADGSVNYFVTANLENLSTNNGIPRIFFEMKYKDTENTFAQYFASNFEWKETGDNYGKCACELAHYPSGSVLVSDLIILLDTQGIHITFNNPDLIALSGVYVKIE